MKHLRKMYSVLLSTVLITSFISMTAFADVANSDQASECCYAQGEGEIVDQFGLQEWESAEAENDSNDSLETYGAQAYTQNAINQNQLGAESSVISEIEEETGLNINNPEGNNAAFGETDSEPADEFSDETGETGTEQPADEFSDETGETGTEQPADEFSDETGETGTEQPASEFSEKAGETGTERPAGEFSDEAGETGTEQPASEFSDEAGDTVSEPVDESSGWSGEIVDEVGNEAAHEADEACQADEANEANEAGKAVSGSVNKSFDKADETLDKVVEKSSESSDEAGETMAEPAKLAGETEKTGKCGDNATWTFNESTGLMTISGKGEMWSYNQEEGMGGKTQPWKNWRDKIKRVIIKEGITLVGDSAFYNCGSIQKVDFPESLRVVDNFAFYSCSSLSDAPLPEKLDALGQECFSYCAFTQATIPPYVSFLNNAFVYNKHLKSIKIGGSKEVGGGIVWNGQFICCPELENVEVSPDHFYLCAVNNVLYSKDGALISYPGGRKGDSYRLRDGTSDIMRFSFWGVKHLKKLIIPDSVSHFDTDLFLFDSIDETMPELTIVFEGGCPSFENDTFCGVNVTAYYPKGDDSWNKMIRNTFNGRVTWKEYGISRPILSSVKREEGGVRITWKKVEGAELYQVLRRTEDGIWKKLGTSSTNTYKDETGTIGKKYYYSVRCVSADKKTVQSTYDKEGERIIFYTSLAPELSAVSCVKGGVKLAWTGVSGIEKYSVERKTDGGNWKRIAVTSARNYIDTTTDSSKKCTYSVRCMSGDGKKYLSSRSGEKTIQYIAVPVISAASNFVGGVKLTWKKPAGAVRYRVFRKTGSGSYVKFKDTSATSCVDKTVKSGEQYIYAIRCINSKGSAYSSGQSSSKAIRYIAAPVLNKPLVSAGSVKVSWKKPAGAVKYRIQRKIKGGSWKKLADTQKLYYVDKTAQKGKEYTYIVRCISADGKTSVSSYYEEGVTVKAK